ncbi:nucleoside deaminase [Clostridium pasteurianum]|uniref:Cytosine/adenosine deaminase n=1 Tax=Clostridium pasteurianum BC1 TaxID=86416 RepID=R4K2L4_CLOPA|nr:nucleoside deaminase [Clostridium pasteurianum]AGK96828.1 cytosine/adenosine deaminase [Clostridium pasteurianum BC1]
MLKKVCNKGEIPIAAIIFHGDDVVSKAYTTEKKEGRYLVHAEIQAILEMDKERYSFKTRKELQLFVNLEPCMMCFGAAIHSFIGEVYYFFESPTDGGAAWAEKTWYDNHKDSVFKLPKIYKGILSEESKKIFKNFLDISPRDGYYDWVKTLI